MASSLRLDLERGFQQPIRFKRGEAANVWGQPINAIIEKLDGMEMSPEVADALRELCAEIGQITRDLWEV